MNLITYKKSINPYIQLNIINHKIKSTHLMSKIKYQVKQYGFVSFRPLTSYLPPHIRIFDSISHRMPHNIYSLRQIKQLGPKHYPPRTLTDSLALNFMKTIRYTFNRIFGYNPSSMSESEWLTYLTFIETLTGVHGMVGGMCRHLQSIRLMKRDNGWIHRLLEQADNERFHLMIWVDMKKPGKMMRMAILFGQGVWLGSYFMTYLIAPKYCHRYVGYFEDWLVGVYGELIEQAVKPDSSLRKWLSQPISSQIQQYYHFPTNTPTSLVQTLCCIRADKCSHRQTNHYLASISSDLDIKQQPIKIINQQEKFHC